MIVIENVSVSYGRSSPALRSVSFRLLRGQVTVLLGPSGAGKSTLLRCLNGLMTPSSGTIQVEGIRDLSDPRDRRLHLRRTGMVFQSHQLIGRLTALANVLQGRLGYHSTLRSLFPASSSEARLAIECLERVGMLEQARVRVDRLSGGERQRVGIARALAQEPELILADEPVASLDPVNGERILDLLHRICREDGLTAAISLHQLEYARRFGDRILGLAAGRVVFDGPAPILSQEILEEIYGGQAIRRAEERTPENPIAATQASIQESS